MLAEIITIGDEILIGQTIDTNSAWMGQQLNDLGVDVVQISTIQDSTDSIKNALNLAESRADVILITGGLGPTKDDITKKSIAEYFNVPLVINDDALENIQRIFARLGRDVLGVNKDQALVPENCTPIVNTKGTAPGMYFEEHNKIFASMPGVPYEMKAMMTKEILPRLKDQINDKVIVHETITVIGVPESYIAHTIADIEDNLPEQLKLAYLPNLNLVRLRLTGKSTNHNGDQIHQLIQLEMAKIKSVLGNVWFDGDKNISEILGSMLVEKGNTIGTIESCSGGYVAHQLTAVSGSSAYFVGSLLTYAYEAKVHNADISQDLLNKVGAVSEEVAHDMAKNAQQKLQVDYCISTTGIAGPGGGTETKPVGLVYIGLAKPNGEVEVKKCQFHGNRLQVIQRTANTAINMVRKALMES